MQNDTHTTFHIIINKKNEHEVQVVCARGKIFFKEFEEKNSG